jgi:SPP1 gp7 family putative phage head morphogenesis protein
VTLDPIIHRDGYNRLVETELLAYLEEVLFRPLTDLLAEAGLRQNEVPDPVTTALVAGTIWYADGAFSGRFSAPTSRALRGYGATFRNERFHIEVGQLPYAVRGAIARSKDQSETLHEALIFTLAAIAAMAKQAPTGANYRKAVDVVTLDLQKQFSETVSEEELSGTSAENPPDLSEELAEDLSEPTDAAIKQFTADEAERLRAKIQQNLSAGGRTDRLDDIVQAEIGVAKRKAGTLSANEMSRLVAAYRQRRYEAIGATQYIWQTSGDERVRDSHRALDGRSFFFDSPPVTDPATGRRGNPGEDYNCRCVARVILPRA